jgi:peptide/nickel transport system substrate-binding protein
MLIVLGAALLTTAVLAATALAAGVARSADTSVTVRFTGPYQTLDWQARATTGIIAFSWPVYDRLIVVNPDTHKVLPYLASSWTFSPESRPKVANFQLKRGVKCQDGHELTPIDVLNSFKRFFVVPKISNQLPNLFGAGPYHLHADMKKWTFTFRSETPYANMVFGFGLAGIICPAGLEALKTDPNALQKNMYGSGPYSFVSAVANDSVVYKKNPAWKWGPPGSNINTMPDNLTYKIITDETTAANLLLTGGLDIAPVNGPDVDRLRATPSLEAKTLQNFHHMPLIFNTQGGRATADPKVREALMTAIDRKGFVQAAWGGRAILTPSILNPKMPCYDKTIEKYAPTGGTAKARQLLQADGYTPNSSGIMTKNGQPLRLSLVTTPALLNAGGEFLAKNLRDAGVDVDLRDSQATYSASIVGQNFDVGVAASLLFLPIQANNFGNYSGPSPPKGTNNGFQGGGDQEYTRAALIATQRTGCEWLIKLQRLVLTHHVMLPLGQPTQSVFGNKKWAFASNVYLFEPIFMKPYGK